MKESVFSCGSADRLSGILCSPDEASDRSIVLFLNAGLVPRVGPHRLYVRLARGLAAEGVSSLRLDLSGLGDSESAPSGRSEEDQVIVDVCDALERLESELGYRRFVVMGLCAGAVHAMNAALADKRIVGLVMLDGYLYATPKARLRYLGPKILRWSSWRALFRNLRRRLSSPKSDVGRNFSVKSPHLAAGEFEARIRALTDRGVGVLQIVSGSTPNKFNYERQFEDAFPVLARSGRMSSHYWPEANHTFTELWQQESLVEVTGAWLKALSPRA